MRDGSLQTMARTIPLLLLAIAIPLGGCAAPKQQSYHYPPPVFDTKPPQRTAKKLRKVQVKPAPKRRMEPTRSRGELSATTIIVDPGHGGKDPGAPGTGPVPEKTVNLAVGMKLASILRQMGAAVVTTRDSDTFITLDARANLADRRKVDLLVSIHADAAQSSSATGATIYIAQNASRASEQIASSIDDAFRRAGIKSRGVKRAKYRVLVGHSRPAVLVECGFLTNRPEALRLSQPGYQETMAETIAEGIKSRLGR